MTERKWPGTLDDLVADLTRQRDLYLALIEISKRQRQVLESEDSSALLGIVEEKRRLLAAGEEVDRQVSPWRARWGEVRREIDEADRIRIEKLVDDVGGVLKTLIGLEDECTRLAEKSLAATGQEMNKAVEARKVQSAYRPAKPPGDARFLDRTE